MSEIKNSKILSFPNNLTEPERQVEAVLFAADEPLDIESIQSRIARKINVIKIVRLEHILIVMNINVFFMFVKIFNVS